MKRLYRRFLIILWVLKTDKLELVHIVIALSLRQANGRGNIKPYNDAKRLVETIPYVNSYAKVHD